MMSQLEKEAEILLLALAPVLPAGPQPLPGREGSGVPEPETGKKRYGNW